MRSFESWLHIKFGSDEWMIFVGSFAEGATSEARGEDIARSDKAPALVSIQRVQGEGV